jgi:hypothetical protein
MPLTRTLLARNPIVPVTQRITQIQIECQCFSCCGVARRLTVFGVTSTVRRTRHHPSLRLLVDAERNVGLEGLLLGTVGYVLG